MATLPISTPEELGAVLRMVRKAQGVRADDLAGSAGLGPVFVLDVEHGKPTVQLGKVLELLHEAGIAVFLELPKGIDPGAQSTRALYRKSAVSQRTAQDRMNQRLLKALRDSRDTSRDKT